MTVPSWSHVGTTGVRLSWQILIEQRKAVIVLVSLLWDFCESAAISCLSTWYMVMTVERSEGCGESGGQTRWWLVLIHVNQASSQKAPTGEEGVPEQRSLAPFEWILHVLAFCSYAIEFWLPIEPIEVTVHVWRMDCPWCPVWNRIFNVSVLHMVVK